MLLASLQLAACQQASNGADEDQGTVPLDVVFRSNQCNEADERVIIIRDAAGWSSWRDAQQRLSIGLPDDLAGRATDVDFAQNSVVVIAMGTRPSAGYGIELAESIGHRNNGEITIAVDWQEPGPDAVVAQMLTSPCLAIAVSTTRVDLVTIDRQ